MGSIETKELLWCLLCNRKFSVSDVDSGYYPATGICKECYTEMQSGTNSCFGKVEKYDKESQECGSFCPDRKICSEFVSKISVQKGQRP